MASRSIPHAYGLSYRTGSHCMLSVGACASVGKVIVSCASCRMAVAMAAATSAIGALRRALRSCGAHVAPSPYAIRVSRTGLGFRRSRTTHSSVAHILLAFSCLPMLSAKAWARERSSCARAVTTSFSVRRRVCPWQSGWCQAESQRWCYVIVSSHNMTWRKPMTTWMQPSPSCDVRAAGRWRRLDFRRAATSSRATRCAPKGGVWRACIHPHSHMPLTPSCSSTRQLTAPLGLTRTRRISSTAERAACPRRRSALMSTLRPFLAARVSRLLQPHSWSDRRATPSARRARTLELGARLALGKRLARRLCLAARCLRSSA